MSSHNELTAFWMTGRSHFQRSGSRKALSLMNSPMLSSMRLRIGPETSSNCSLARCFFSAHQDSRRGAARETVRSNVTVLWWRDLRKAAAAPATMAVVSTHCSSAAAAQVTALLLLRPRPLSSSSSSSEDALSELRSSGCRLEYGRVMVSSSCESRTVYRLPARCITIASMQFRLGKFMLQRRTLAPACKLVSTPGHFGHTQ
mmetsp:Transcript_2154/g.4797  ORF Transcript_2154/g.4797 Transcript_2154/m.4797 type:complete len:202 (-) Transcript_2154:111-716(-)